MSLLKTHTHVITEQEYIQGELLSDIRHEYIDGCVYAMVGATKKHNVISVNVTTEIRNQLKHQQSSCNIFTSDMKVRVNHADSIRYFYPDVMLVCNDHDDTHDQDDYFQDNPVMIFEVLSNSTEKYDKSEKRLAYFSIASLKYYILVEQNKCEVLVFERRVIDGSDSWQANYYFLGDDIQFDSLGLTLAVEDIYYQVNAEELAQYKKLQAEQEQEAALENKKQ